MKEPKIVKKVMPSGNAGGIYVPKGWVSQQVVVRLLGTEECILEMLRPHMEHVSGAYLYGSHARHEADDASDINVFLVADRMVPVEPKHGVSMEVFTKEALSAFSHGSPVECFCMVNEAVALKRNEAVECMKDQFLDGVKIRRFCRDARRSLEFSDRLAKEKDYDSAAYSLIHCLRSLYVVDAGVRKYTHRGFKSFLLEKGLTSRDFYRLYDLYRAIRDERPAKMPAREEDVVILMGVAVRLLSKIESIYPQIIKC